MEMVGGQIKLVDVLQVHLKKQDCFPVIRLRLKFMVRIFHRST